jgi:hypothetical protein
MRSVRVTDVFALPNLLSNGGFDRLVTTDGVTTAAYWTVSGASSETLGAGGNRYTFVTAEDSDEEFSARDYVRLSLSESRPVVLSQSFLADPAQNALDFPVPLLAGSDRQEVLEGFRSVYTKLLPRSRSFTVGVAARINRGRAILAARFLDASGRTIGGVDLNPVLDAKSSKRKWRRWSGVLTPPGTPASIEIYVQRISAGDFVELHLGELQLITGAYDEAPYTGDPGLTAIPKGAIIFSLGESCPPGFEELPAADGTIPAEWLAADPEAELRFKAFPIGATSSTGAVAGSPTHNRSEYSFRLALDDVEAFESFEGKIAESPDNSAVGYNPSVTVPADEPDAKGTANHQHNVLDAGSLPVNRPLRLCRRV